MEMLGWDADRTRNRIDDTIYENVLRICLVAGAEGITPGLAADRQAEERLGSLTRS
jgi:hypothetical protein